MASTAKPDPSVARRAYRIEELPDDLAADLEAGLDALWNPDLTVEDGDTVIE
ncbi:MAG TPA: hypothetical protein VGG65_10395 [Thermoanaerobaculia bacterium]